MHRNRNSMVFTTPKTQAWGQLTSTLQHSRHRINVKVVKKMFGSLVHMSHLPNRARHCFILQSEKTAHKLRPRYYLNESSNINKTLDPWYFEMKVQCQWHLQKMLQGLGFHLLVLPLPVIRPPSPSGYREDTVIVYGVSGFSFCRTTLFCRPPIVALSKTVLGEHQPSISISTNC